MIVHKSRFFVLKVHELICRNFHEKHIIFSLAYLRNSKLFHSKKYIIWNRFGQLNAHIWSGCKLALESYSASLHSTTSEFPKKMFYLKRIETSFGIFFWNLFVYFSLISSHEVGSFKKYLEFNARKMLNCCKISMSVSRRLKEPCQEWIYYFLRHL